MHEAKAKHTKKTKKSSLLLRIASQLAWLGYGFVVFVIMAGLGSLAALYWLT